MTMGVLYYQGADHYRIICLHFVYSMQPMGLTESFWIVPDTIDLD